VTDLAELLAGAPPMPLGRGDPAEASRGRIAAADVPPACRAGLWLRFNFLDESHAVSQELHTPEGSLWHGLMHRREGDYWNAKYWFRQAGPHPVWERLAVEAPRVGFLFTTPAAFADVCEQSAGTGTPHERELERVQLLEWEVLFDWCRGHGY
jgi:hypothetical protein